MRKEEFYFESRDNISRIHAVRYTPDGGDVKGVVQIVHGMAEYVERYEEFAAYLTRRGYVVTGEDHLGHGKSVGENGFGYFCEQDPATVVVREKIPVKLSVLVVSGSDDPVGEYGEGVRRAAASMKTVGLKQLTCKLYPGARHELLNETDREAVMKDLVDWIEADV